MLTIEFHPLSFEDGCNGVLMCTSNDGFLRLWHVNTERQRASDPPMKYYCKTLTRDSIRMAAFSPSGARIITGATDGVVRLLRTPSFDEVKRGSAFPTLQPYVYHLEEHEGSINCMAYSADATSFLTGSWDGTVRLWSFDGNVNNWVSRPYSTLTAGRFSSRKGRKVTMVSFANGDEYIAAAVNELFAVLIFDRHTGRTVHTLQYHSTDIQIVQCHPQNDRILLTASYDGSVALWNVVTGRQLFSHRSTCRFLDGTFSPSGDFFALTDDLGRATLYACGVSGDSFALAPECQFLVSDWLDPTFDESRMPVDPIAQRPAHLNPPLVTCGLERDLNPVQVARGFFAPVVPAGWAGSLAQLRWEDALQKKQAAELALFERERAVCPPGIAPRHRSRKRKVFYGSDVEEFVDEPVFPTVYLEDDDEPERRQRDGLRAPRLPASAAAAAADEEEEEVYDPSGERLERARRRASRADATRSAARASRRGDPEPVEWLSINNRTYSPYLPQIFDIVAYFPEGHRTFLENERRAEFHRDVPAVVTNPNRRALQSPIIAQVVEARFYVMDWPWCQIKVVPLDDDTVTEAAACIVDPDSASALTISYYDMADTPDFIILACRYHWSLQQQYSTGQVVRVIYGHEESYNGRIIRVGPTRRTYWQCYLVEWLTLDDPPEECSPWELEPFEDAFEAYHCTEAIPSHVLRLLDDGMRSICSQRRAEHLVDPVDYRSFPEYLGVVAYPMCLTQMHERLQSGFYRRIESLLWDADQIRNNALIFNEPDSPIVRDSSFIYQMVEALARRAQRPSRHAVARGDSAGWDSAERVSVQRESVGRASVQRESVGRAGVQRTSAVLDGATRGPVSPSTALRKRRLIVETDDEEEEEGLTLRHAASSRRIPEPPGSGRRGVARPAPAGARRSERHQ